MFIYSYYVPTNRTLGENLTGFCEELKYSQEKYNIEIPFVLIDDQKESNNYSLLADKAKKYRDIKFFYFSNERIKSIYDTIGKNLKLTTEFVKSFSALYPGSKPNYGNVFNRIFIIAILLGSDFIFRRDSDVHIQLLNGKYLFPIEIELKYLSKTVDNKTVYIVGGGYNGKWGIDIDCFIREEDYSLVRDFFSCLLIPEEEHNEIIQMEILNNRTFIEDQIIFNSAAYPDCGNCSYYNIFKYIPCSPSDYTIGTDYFLVEVGLNLGLNVGYHNRAVMHRYTSDRYESEEKLFNYWLGIAMLIDLKVLYKNYYRGLRMIDFKINEKYDELNQIVFKTLSKFEKEIDYYTEIRKEKLNNFSLLLEKVNNDSFKKISNYIRINIENIIKHTDMNLHNHVNLIKIWRDIVGSIYKVRDSKEMQAVIFNSNIN